MKSFKTHMLEAKKANTASTRQELSNRPRKPDSAAEAERKKKESDDAWERLMAHAANKKTNEEVIAEGAYEKAEENKKSADSAKKQGDMFAHHLHMADHHDNMSQWHAEKGRHGEANKHAEKAEQHHEKAMALKEEVELKEAVKIGSKVKMHAPGKDYHGQVGHVGEIRHGAFKGAAKTYTVDYANGKSVQLDKKNIKLHHEETMNFEEVEQIDELSSDLLQRYKDKAMKSAADLSSQGKYKKSTDRLIGHMKATGKQMAKTLKKEEAERCEICGEAPCACDDSHGFVEGLKPEHKMRPGWMLKADPELAKKVAANKKKYKSFKDVVGKKIENK